MPIDGILPVIPTPFKDGRFDETSFGRFLDHMLPFLDGYTLLGSTGEAPSLSTQDRKKITEIALSMTPRNKTVVVGVSHTSAAEAIELAEHAQSHGARAALCSAPYYFRNSPAGILDHLRAVDRVLQIDLVLYDNPISTKTTLPAETIVGWRQELEHLTAVKLTDHDLDKISVFHDANLNVFAGDDPIIFRYLAAGVDGVMVIAPAVFPEAFRETWNRVQEGDLTGAYSVFALEILPFTHVFGIGDEIETTKALLEDIGVFASAQLLSPLRPATPQRREMLRIAYELAKAHTMQRIVGPAVAPQVCGVR